MANTPSDLTELVRRCDPQFVNERNYTIDQYFADLATIGQVMRIVPRYDAILDTLCINEFSLRKIASGMFAEAARAHE
jgi:hypothetical protein